MSEAVDELKESERSARGFLSIFIWQTIRFQPVIFGLLAASLSGFEGTGSFVSTPTGQCPYLSSVIGTHPRS